jgi:hypothetical protein
LFSSRGAAASPAPALREKKGHSSQVLEHVEVVLAEERKARGSASKAAGGNGKGYTEVVMIEVPAWI